MSAKVKKRLLVALAALLTVVLALGGYLRYQVYYGRSVPSPRPNTVRIACVGDSITYGINFFVSEGYPPQLGLLLGGNYSVGNFGAIGDTAQKQTDWPYWEHRYFGLSSAYAPNVVIIMLGTNDSKPENWVGATRFSEDYRALVEHYRELPLKPRIMLMTPPSTFLVRGRSALPSGINGERITEISGIVRTIGASLSIPVVDIHGATASHPEFFQWDGVHPDTAGDKFIAQVLYDRLRAILQS